MTYWEIFNLSPNDLLYETTKKIQNFLVSIACLRYTEFAQTDSL